MTKERVLQAQSGDHAALEEFGRWVLENVERNVYPQFRCDGPTAKELIEHMIGVCCRILPRYDSQKGAPNTFFFGRAFYNAGLVWFDAQYSIQRRQDVLETLPVGRFMSTMDCNLAVGLRESLLKMATTEYGGDSVFVCVLESLMEEERRPEFLRRRRDFGVGLYDRVRNTVRIWVRQRWMEVAIQHGIV